MAIATPELKKFVQQNKKGGESISNNPQRVRASEATFLFATFSLGTCSTLPVSYLLLEKSSVSPLRTSTGSIPVAVYPIPRAIILGHIQSTWHQSAPHSVSLASVRALSTTRSVRAPVGSSQTLLINLKLNQSPKLKLVQRRKKTLEKIQVQPDPAVISRKHNLKMNSAETVC